MHVVPVDDLIEHDSSGEADCTCGPTTEPVEADDGSIGWVVVHHSLDGRELHEEGQQAPRAERGSMLASIVRTVVPLIVGALITLAARYLGVDLPEGALTEVVTVAVSGAYYAVVRLLEEHVSPIFGQVLLGLGLKAKPTYELAA